jgi:SAM-dependent methyltransferase
VNFRPLALLALVGGAAAIRRDLVVRVIRAIDRRGGLFARRGARAYTVGSRLFSGLHRRVAADAAAMVGSRDVTVIDIGSGPGDLLAELRARAPRARLVGVEPSDAMRTIAAERGVVTVDGRAEALPFADGTADLVLSTLSSHHWDDVAAAFTEIRRVLRSGGLARIYDVRFAGYGPLEARRFGLDAGFGPDDIEHTILDERMLGLRPYALITLRPRSIGVR